MTKNIIANIPEQFKKFIDPTSMYSQDPEKIAKLVDIAERLGIIKTDMSV